MDDMNWFMFDTNEGRVKFQWDADHPTSKLWGLLDNGEEEYTLITPYTFEDANDLMTATKLLLQYHNLRMIGEVKSI